MIQHDKNLILNKLLQQPKTSPRGILLSERKSKRFKKGVGVE